MCFPKVAYNRNRTLSIAYLTPCSDVRQINYYSKARRKDRFASAPQRISSIYRPNSAASELPSDGWKIPCIALQRPPPAYDPSHQESLSPCNPSLSSLFGFFHNAEASHAAISFWIMSKRTSGPLFESRYFSFRDHARIPCLCYCAGNGAG